MKKFSAILMLILVLLCLIGTVVWGVICMQDYQRIVNDPATSGIDYLVGFVYALGFAAIGIFGFAFGLMLAKISEKTMIKMCAYICTAIFALEVLAAVFVVFL